MVFIPGCYVLRAQTKGKLSIFLQVSRYEYHLCLLKVTWGDAQSLCENQNIGPMTIINDDDVANISAQTGSEMMKTVKGRKGFVNPQFWMTTEERFG